MSIFISRKMRYFMAIMEKKNFTKAAEALCITRSPLSKVVCELEDLLGEKLFTRKHNDLEPTQLAWECYNKCQPLFHSLQELEENLINTKLVKPLSLIFDFSVPELMTRQLKMIVRSEKMDLHIERKLITIDDVCSLQQKPAHAIMSFRPLGGGESYHCDSWEGGYPVIVGNTEKKSPTGSHNVFIWKDQYIQCHKKRYEYLFSQVDITCNFIEHNYDIATLLYLARAGKGLILMSEKMARLCRVEFAEMKYIKATKIRCYIYYNYNSRRSKDIESFKKVATGFF